MPKNSSPWSTISMKPLTGVLDVRSRPADLDPAAFRYKLNVATTPEGQVGRLPGFARAFSDKLYDSAGDSWSDPEHSGTGYYYKNHDHHRQGATREPITFLYEFTSSDQVRYLFDGTQSRVSLLNEDTGVWSDIITGKGAYGSRWRADTLQDVILFTNGVDDVLAYELNGAAAPIPALQTLHITAAKVVIQFSGVLMLMNMQQDGKRQLSRIWWSDLNGPRTWGIDTSEAPTSISGYQDLDYGDEILAAAPALGSLYIYTRRAIWKCSVASGVDQTFSFTRVYNEPKNQSGMLAYPFTLVSTGTEHYYLSRDGIYKFSPYLPQPEREDWLHRASGAIFTQSETAMGEVNCNAPVAEYVPSKKELWFSWASGNTTVNNWTLVAQTAQKTATVVDHGFSVLVNYRRTPALGAICNEHQEFLGASGRDWCLKTIGAVYSTTNRSYINAFERQRLKTVLDASPSTDQASDLVPTTDYLSEGYYTLFRGMVPLGFYDREKILRLFLVDHDTSEELIPCVLKLRVGCSYSLADPNNAGNYCAVRWRDAGTRPLACPHSLTPATMSALNIRPAEGTEWELYEQGRFLYYELTIQSADGSPAIGGDTWFARFDFEAMALAKP